MNNHELTLIGWYQTQLYILLNDLDGQYSGLSDREQKIYLLGEIQRIRRGFP